MTKTSKEIDNRPEFDDDRAESGYEPPRGWKGGAWPDMDEHVQDYRRATAPKYRSVGEQLRERGYFK